MKYVRGGHSDYFWNAELQRWDRTHLYGFSPPIVASDTLRGMDEAQGRAWLTENGWKAEEAE